MRNYKLVVLVLPAHACVQFRRYTGTDNGAEASWVGAQTYGTHPTAYGEGKPGNPYRFDNGGVA